MFYVRCLTSRLLEVFRTGNDVLVLLTEIQACLVDGNPSLQCLILDALVIQGKQ